MQLQVSSEWWLILTLVSVSACSAYVFSAKIVVKRKNIYTTREKKKKKKKTKLKLNITSKDSTAVGRCIILLIIRTAPHSSSSSSSVLDSAAAAAANNVTCTGRS